MRLIVVLAVDASDHICFVQRHLLALTDCGAVVERSLQPLSEKPSGTLLLIQDAICTNLSLATQFTTLPHEVNDAKSVPAVRDHLLVAPVCAPPPLPPKPYSK